MDWKSAKTPKGARLFKVHHFNFLYNGANYVLELDEYGDGTWSGHAESTADKNFVIESVSGKDMKDCIEVLIAKIESRAVS